MGRQLLLLRMPSSLTRQGKPVYGKLRHMKTIKRIFSLLFFFSKKLTSCYLECGNGGW
ncbi:hypothetical protein Q9233_000003 [Columba guinea]|nr:hypothetical protein Q9233_000003 [Columba guinea]